MNYAARRCTLRPPIIVRWAYQQLRQLKLTPIMTDKDGGFCLVRTQDVESIKLKAILADKSYKEEQVNFNFLDEWLVAYRSVAWKISCRIGSDNTDTIKSLMNAFTSGIQRFPKEGLITPISMKIKTHKDQGAIVPRLLHNSREHPFRPAMFWIAAELKPFLKSKPHLLVDSADLARQIKGITIPADGVMIKIDIKNYFMSGDHQTLIDQSSRCIRRKVRDLYKSMLDTILQAQWIAPHRGSNKTFRVTIGSGMGMPCSGEVSDAAFYFLAEDDFVLNERIRSHYRVYSYYRFKDDILLIIGGNKETRRLFMNEFKKHSRCFKLDIETVSDTGVNMLDVWVEKESPRCRSKLVIDMYEKPTSIKRYLAATSMHAPSVHRSWPRAQVARIRRLCGRAADANVRISAFSRDLAFNDAWPPSTDPRPPSDSTSARSQEIIVSWLTLPFHAAWSSSDLPNLVYRACREAKNSLLVRIAWCLGGNHMCQSFSVPRL